MNTNVKNIGWLFLASIALTSCSKDDATQDTKILPPTAASFYAIKEQGVKSLTQTFEVNVAEGTKTLTSKKGVKFTINPADILIGGSPATGVLTVSFVEIFDGGNMITTDKPTMGVMPDNKMAMLVSGGELFISCKKGDVEGTLKPGATVLVNIPVALTGNVEDGMQLWDGVINKEGDLGWNLKKDTAGDNNGGVRIGKGDGANGVGTTYDANLGFGWTNVDKFYSDPRPKTTILAAVPDGYNYQNSAVYLHYDGEGNALAKLDTYDTATHLFSEHYGQIPIGLVCHMIFVTEEAGQWKYAIKAVTITAGTTYTFTLSETIVGSMAQLQAAINALP